MAISETKVKGRGFPILDT